MVKEKPQKNQFNDQEMFNIERGSQLKARRSKIREQTLNIQPVCVGLVGKATSPSRLDGFIEH